MILIVWNSSYLINASGTTVPWSSLWIKSTFISTKVSCDLNGSVLICICVSKVFKDILSMYTFAMCNSKYCRHVYKQHIMAKTFYFMSWSSLLTTIELHAFKCNGHPCCINNLPMPKLLAPYAPQKVCQTPQI